MSPSPLFQALSAYAKKSAWRYLYPVWSRRAQGISIGINLHPNHCCNWHCLYCQVPDLKRGPSPLIDMALLAQELTACLDWLTLYTRKNQQSLSQCIQDIAFAGDGEPTTSPQFSDALQLVASLLSARNPQNKPAMVRLITNGSQIHHPPVQQALMQLQQLGGEVWFKVDAGNDTEMRQVNDCQLSLALHLQRLQICCRLCKTWVQTAVMCRVLGELTVTTPTQETYLTALLPLKDAITGILLYGISRPSQQEYQGCIQPTSASTLDTFAKKLRTQGFCVRIFL